MHKQIAESRQALLCSMPNSLQDAVFSALNQRYGELYEPEENDSVLLEDTLKEILDSFQRNQPLLGQLRYVWMALTLAAIVEPTVKYYQPNSQIPEKTIDLLTDWLLETLVEMLAPKKQLHSISENTYSNISLDLKHLLSTNELSSLQVLSEALDVYREALETLEPDRSLQALLNILEDCLEGYAIFPGADGRRELFNWWLSDVVPSCWYLLPPTSVYSLKDADRSSALSRLGEISSSVWSLIRSAVQHKKEDGKYQLSDNTLLATNDRVGIQIKYSQPLLSNANVY